MAEVPDDSLLVAMADRGVSNAERSQQVRFACLPGTWREKAPEGIPKIPKGRLLAFLNPSSTSSSMSEQGTQMTKRRPKVAQREDLQLPRLGGSEA